MKETGRILVVDDDPRQLKALERMLRPVGGSWELCFVQSGTEALERLARQPFDAVVSDMQMPGMDGATLLEQVREDHSDVIRIMLGGHTEHEAVLRAIPVAHQSLTKPVDAATLSEVLERTLSLRALLESEALRAIVTRAEGLPAMPRVYRELTEALDNTEISVRRIAAIVEKDPAICAKLLQLVNSAFFGISRRMSSIQHAVSYLGTHIVKSVVLALGVFRSLPNGALRQPPTAEQLQRHALLAANIASNLMTRKRQVEDAFMAGMLHDIGMLVLITRTPEAFQAALTEARSSGRPLHEVERKTYGVCHAEVGAYLLGLWGLPYPIVEAVANHHTPGWVKSRSFDLPGAVHVADILASEIAETGLLIESAAGPHMGYLEALGVADRLASWRKMAQEVAGAVPV